MKVTYTSPMMSWDDQELKFLLHEDMSVRVTRKGHMPVEYVVDEGFYTDLASIPKRLQGLINKLGHHILPAIFHDAAYAGQFPGVTKAQADKIFLAGMKTQGVPWMRRRLMYAAVRVNINGGHWNAGSRG